MKIASNDIRKAAVDAYLSGKGTQQQLADIFGFHRTAIARWVRDFKKTGKLEPLPRGHMAKAFTAEGVRTSCRNCKRQAREYIAGNQRDVVQKLLFDGSASGAETTWLPVQKKL